MPAIEDFEAIPRVFRIAVEDGTWRVHTAVPPEGSEQYTLTVPTSLRRYPDTTVADEQWADLERQGADLASAMRDVVLLERHMVQFAVAHDHSRSAVCRKGCPARDAYEDLTKEARHDVVAIQDMVAGHSHPREVACTSACVVWQAYEILIRAGR